MISVNVDSQDDITELLKLIDISKYYDPDVIEINLNKIFVTFGLVKKSLATLQREIQELQDSSSNSGSSGSVSLANTKYFTPFEESEWVQQSNGSYTLKILPSVHHLGTNVTLESITKKNEGSYDNVIVT